MHNSEDGELACERRLPLRTKSSAWEREGQRLLGAISRAGDEDHRYQQIAAIVGFVDPRMLGGTRGEQLARTGALI